MSIYQSGINEKTIVTCSVRNVSSNHNIHIGENLPFKQYYAPVYTLYKSKRCVFTHPGTDTELSFNVFIAHVDRHSFPSSSRTNITSLTITSCKPNGLINTNTTLPIPSHSLPSISTLTKCVARSYVCAYLSDLTAKQTFVN